MGVPGLLCRSGNGKESEGRLSIKAVSHSFPDTLPGDTTVPFFRGRYLFAPDRILASGDFMGIRGEIGSAMD